MTKIKQDSTTTEVKKTDLELATTGAKDSLRKKEEYKVLQDVANEMDFSFDDLVTMYMAESSGRSDVENDLGYVGGFQFGKKAGTKYGLVSDYGDFRKDLRKSATAAIKFARDNTKDDILLSDGVDANGDPKFKKMGKTFSNLLAENDIPESLAVYLTHQQGRGGFIDLVTGSKSGRVSEGTIDKMSENLGFNDKQKEEFKLNANKGDSAKLFLNSWKNRWSEKKKEAANWMAEGAPTDHKVFNAVKDSGKSENIVSEADDGGTNAIRPD